jgi:hypothetical protein
MSDAQNDSHKMLRENKEKVNFFEALITYLCHPSPENKIQAHSALKKYTEVLGRDSLRSFQSLFQKLENNDHKTWKEVSEREDCDIFISRPDLQKLFIQAAEKRNIGKLQWVL